MADSELWSALVKRLTQVLADAFEQRLRRHGLTLAQWGLLRRLWVQDGRSQVELQNLLQVEPSSITGLVQRLERLGLVYRQTDPVDKRVRRVYLTEEGYAREPLARHLAEEVNAQALRDFTPEERQAFFQMLARAISNVTGEEKSKA
jgi:DNA-binding MarR family transcriptional regulator